ncbi:MAG: hypothetical protein AB7P76_10055 [Candidatus Melainabacteria bacterium]
MSDNLINLEALWMIPALTFGMALLGDKDGNRRVFTTHYETQRAIHGWHSRQSPRRLNTTNALALVAETPDGFVVATNTAASGLGSDGLADSIASSRILRKNLKFRVPNQKLTVKFSELYLLKQISAVYLSMQNMQTLKDGSDWNNDLRRRSILNLIQNADVLPDWPERYYK